MKLLLQVKRYLSSAKHGLYLARSFPWSKCITTQSRLFFYRAPFRLYFKPT